MKKAQGLPLNAIVIAAIVLIVLVVLILIFTGRIGAFTSGVQDCASRGGNCVSGPECGSNQVKISPATGCPTSNVCCVSEPTTQQ